MDINQNYQTLLSNVTYIKHLFDENGKYLPQIQKINSSPDFIVLHIRFFKKSWNIYLGRGGTATGLLLANLNVPPTIRIKDKFLDLFRATLNHSYIKGIEIDQNDKIIKINTIRNNEDGVLEYDFCLFWKGRELFFLILERSLEYKILKSWEGNWLSCSEDPLLLFKVFDEVGRNNQCQIFKSEDISLEENNRNIEQHFKGLIEKIEEQSNKKYKNKLNKKIQNIKNDLEKLINWKSFYAYFQKDEKEVLEKNNFKLQNVKIKFDSGDDYFKRRNLVFEKCKNAIKNIPFVEIRLKGECEKLAELNNSIKKTEIKALDLKSKIINPRWAKSLTLNGDRIVEKKNENYIIFKTSLCEIAVGLNAPGNDELRKSWATKESFWFHAEMATSCHVIIRCQKELVLDFSLLELIGSMIIEFSNIKSDEINMIYTKVKYLKSLKNNAGSVSYKHEKHIRIVYKNDWRQIISVL